MLASIIERIHRGGPLRYGAFVEQALYGDEGFFTTGGGAGRAGRDFVTSPEVGPLFGVCVARALDGEWRRLRRPDPFMVVEAGAGNGRLAREVLRAEPTCSPALHYVLVERSAILREEQVSRLQLEPFADVLGPASRDGSDDSPIPVTGLGPVMSALGEMPALPMEGVVLANELLDNLAFEIVERSEGGWDEVRVGLDRNEGLTEMLVPAAPDLVGWVRSVDVPVGTRLPIALEAVEWIVDAAALLRRGALVIIDYTAPWSELAERDGGWLRTYAAHSRGADPLVAPGSQDITTDVPLEMVYIAARRAGLTVERVSSQSEWLHDLGIDELVAAGNARWDAGAAAPDLAAIAGRSRATEAAALTDPTGLGAHTVLVLTKP